MSFPQARSLLLCVALTAALVQRAAGDTRTIGFESPTYTTGSIDGQDRHRDGRGRAGPVSSPAGPGRLALRLTPPGAGQ